MKRTIIAVIVAAASISSFGASAITTGLNGVTSGRAADAANNAYGHSYMNAKNNQSATKGQMAKAGKQAQVAANNAMANGLHTAAAQSYTKNDPTGHAAPTASQETGYSKAMETNNTIGGRVTTASALANTMDQGVKNDPTGHAAPVASAPTAKSKAMESANIMGAKVTAAASPTDMGAITAGKMASASNPVGKAPNTMDQGTKMNPAGNPVNVSTAPEAKSAAMESANIMGAKVTAASAPVDMGAITKGKMASATNPVGAAPNTMDQGVKTNPVGNPVSMKAVTSTPETGNTMNLAAKDMKPGTKVNVTDKSGKVTQTTAGAIAKANPEAQVAVNFASQFSFNQPKGGSNHDNAGSNHGGHNGRGSDNAHSHAFGGHGYGHDNSRSEGFGGHSHFH